MIQIPVEPAITDKGTAAGLSLCCEPTALAGDTATTDPTATTAVKITELACVSKLLEVLGVRIVTVISHAHENLAALFACCLP